MPKQWKHEEAVQRTEALIKETADVCGCESCQEWAASANHVIAALRIAKPRQTTPLVLACIDLAGKELASKRGAHSRLFLLVAQAMVEGQLMHACMNIYQQAFARPVAPGNEPAQQLPPGLDIFQKIMQAMSSSELPDGMSVVEIAPGLKTQIIKIPLKKKKKSPISQPGNPLN